jgi:organic hydroperoxide reductase OsmC/OhrA
MLTQVAKFSPLYGVEILAAEADVRANFSLADKYDLGGQPGAFQQVSFQLRVESPASPNRVAELCRHAERACHASQTFKVEVPTTLEVSLNGASLELGSGEENR